MITLEPEYDSPDNSSYLVLLDGEEVGSMYVYNGKSEQLRNALGKMQKALLSVSEFKGIYNFAKEENKI